MLAKRSLPAGPLAIIIISAVAPLPADDEAPFAAVTMDAITLANAAANGSDDDVDEPAVVASVGGTGAALGAVVGGLQLAVVPPVPVFCVPNRRSDRNLNICLLREAKRCALCGNQKKTALKRVQSAREVLIFCVMMMYSLYVVVESQLAPGYQTSPQIHVRLRVLVLCHTRTKAAGRHCNFRVLQYRCCMYRMPNLSQEAALLGPHAERSIMTWWHCALGPIRRCVPQHLGSVLAVGNFLAVSP